MSEFNTQKRMIQRVANALGTELLNKVVFVGGCTTGLFITDEFTIEQIRSTDDVDLILSLMGGKAEWFTFQDRLRKNGFKEKMSENAPVCAMWLGELRVDFMPDDEEILGFSNRWYKEAQETAQIYDLDGTSIRLVTPPYFIGTKLEAFKGRGNGDALTSQDIEDVLNLIDGRESLMDEMAASSTDLRKYIADEFKLLLKLPSMSHAVDNASLNDKGRKELLFERIDNLIELGS